MKLNMLSLKRIKRGLAAAGLFLCLMFVTVPVFAAPEDETVTTEAAAETQAQTEAASEAETTKAAEPETKKKEETKKQEETKAAETETKPDKGLTPVGNLTLIDDVVSAVDGNKEFLTVVSKSGNYFYLVIDRDTDGTGNVYFLNLVDENDLYALTGEKAPVQTSVVPEVSESPTIALETPAKEVKEETETKELTEEEIAKNKQKSLMITVGVLAAVGVGVVIYVLKSKKNKRKRSDEYDLSDFDDEE